MTWVSHDWMLKPDDVFPFGHPVGSGTEGMRYERSFGNGRGATEALRYGLPLQILRRIDLERQHPLNGLTVRLPGGHSGEQFHRSFGERRDRV